MNQVSQLCRDFSPIQRLLLGWENIILITYSYPSRRPRTALKLGEAARLNFFICSAYAANARLDRGTLATSRHMDVRYASVQGLMSNKARRRPVKEEQSVESPNFTTSKNT